MIAPDLHSTVTLSAPGGLAVRARVELAQDGVLTLRVSAAVPPPPVEAGDPVTLRWSAGARGRYTIAGTVHGAAGPRLTVTLDGEAALEQVRRFVRGGGGEKVWVRPADSAEAVAGVVRDLGEQGLRARFDGKQAQPGAHVVLLVELDDDTIELRATVLDSRVDEQVEIIFAFQPDEPEAQAIRRHVLRRQMLARARTGGY